MKTFLLTSLLCCAFFAAFSQQAPGCLAFDGIDDYVQVDNIWMSGDFSVAAWFKADKRRRGSTDERILGFGPAVKLEMGISSDSSFSVFDEALGQISLPKKNVRDGNWHHFVFVKSGPNRYIYLDGEELANYAESIETKYYPLLRFGVWTGATNQNSYFHGWIDEVKLWNSGLSAIAVKTTMKTESRPDELMLQGYWNFNQDDRDKVTPNIVADRTKTNRKGQLVNFDFADDEALNWQKNNPPSVLPAPAATNSAMLVAQPIEKKIETPPAPPPPAAVVEVAKIEPPKPEPTRKAIGDVTIFDMNGRTVHQIYDADLSNIDLSQFMNGMYYFTVNRKN